MAVSTLRLLGGRLCLNFVNTIEDRTSDQPEEQITSYDDLVTWATRADALLPEIGSALREQALHDSEAAARAVKQALALREALYRIFLKVARASAPDTADLRLLQGAYIAALANGDLLEGRAAFHWEWEGASDRLDQMLWPIAVSAIEVLMSDDLRRIKICSSEMGCGWIFYDSSKNGSRRWCSMEGCGSQHKMRAHYARTRLSAGESTHSRT